MVHSQQHPFMETWDPASMWLDKVWPEAQWRCWPGKGGTSGRGCCIDKPGDLVVSERVSETRSQRDPDMGWRRASSDWGGGSCGEAGVWACKAGFLLGQVSQQSVSIRVK